MFRIALLINVSCTLLSISFGSSNIPLESDELINYVNRIQTTWKARRNFHPNLTAEYIKYLCGLESATEIDIPLSKSYLSEAKIVEDKKFVELPTSFDARKKWPYCKSLQEVRDQGPCGSCWAVSSASTFTDRLCIATKGKWNGHLSTQELLTCSGCGSCEGSSSSLVNVWKYLMHSGIVTGGDYNSKEGCQPYELQPCEHGTNGSRPLCYKLNPERKTPECKKKCITSKIDFNRDHVKVRSVYTMSDIKEVQRDIMNFGPVVSGFEIRPDFISYDKGVYHPTVSKIVGFHAVKVIGWGVEDGVDYWLASNSWHDNWGDHGLFKIRRGKNDCSFESFIVTGRVK